MTPRPSSVRAKQPRSLPCSKRHVTLAEVPTGGAGACSKGARICKDWHLLHKNACNIQKQHLGRALGDVDVRGLGGRRQPLNAADEEVVLHGVEVEGVAVAGERHVEVSCDYFAREHEVRAGGGGLRLRLRVSKIALDLLNFVPWVGSAQHLPVIGGGLQHGRSAPVDRG